MRTIQQLTFQMKDGQVVRDAAGAPIPDVVMIQKMTKTLSPEKITAALSAALGPDEMNQLAIDGQYQWRGASKEQLKSATDASYTNRLNQINETLKGYAVQKLSNTNDRAYQQDLDNKIKEQGLHRDSLISKYTTDIKSLDQNPKAYMGEMYKENWISNLTTGYAQATNSFTYHDNPYEKDRLERDKDARETAIFNAEYGKGGYKQQELDLRKRAQDLQLEEFLLKKSGKLDKDGNPIPPSLNAPVQGTIGAGNLAPTPTLDTFNQTTDNMKVALEGAKRNVAASLFNGLPGIQDQVVVDPVSGVLTYRDDNAKAFVETGLANLRDKWINNPASVPTAARTYFEEYDDTNNRINNRNKRLATINTAADKVANLDEIYKGISGMTLSANGVAPVGVSAKDLAAFSRKMNQVYAGAGSGQGHIFLDDNKANEIFTTPQEKILYHTLKTSFNGDQLTPSQQLIMNKIGEVNKATARSLPKVEARGNYINSAVPNLVQSEIPASFPINTSNPAAKGKVNDLANLLVKRYQGQGAGNLPGGSNLKDFGTIFKNEKGTTFSLDAQGQNKYLLTASNAGSGVPAQSLPLTADDIKNYFPEANINQFSAVTAEALALTKYANKNTTDVQNTGATSAFVLTW